MNWERQINGYEESQGKLESQAERQTDKDRTETE